MSISKKEISFFFFIMFLGSIIILCITGVMYNGLGNCETRKARSQS